MKHCFLFDLKSTVMVYRGKFPPPKKEKLVEIIAYSLLTFNNLRFFKNLPNGILTRIQKNSK